EARHHRPCLVGDTLWIDLPHQGKPSGVVVVAATGRTSAPPEAVPALVVEQAMLRAARELRHQRQGQAPRSERTLIALPAFRMGAGGRWDQELESARGQLRKARGVLNRDELADTDVVFVTYTQQIYQTYLEARRRESGEPPCEQPELERALRSGECVLF